MLNVAHFRLHVVRPTLEHMNMWSPASENLVLATGIHESALCYLKQIGGGPALGVYQMEPATHKDIWLNFLKFRPELSKIIVDLFHYTEAESMIAHLGYATAMCRLQYYRVPLALPESNDAVGMAEYWKKYYNTHLGAGTIEGFARDFREYAG